jgi:hypothetical protein
MSTSVKLAKVLGEPAKRVDLVVCLFKPSCQIKTMSLSPTLAAIGKSINLLFAIMKLDKRMQ